ncbi:MAG TPA: phosphate signaling complex protein PhoU [Petrotogaceae bacterium]|mgnify:FL=1|jgi:phosphate transport system protein|nr:phosphate signaling complex protein PhoU [Petrotogaceae bacterium]HQF33021.1 phosphate signaling complex protein PhoU [Petrotogaceae bacterium]HQH32061.1 phosphate signaling complex protein PhoU [Petrotogaceae bacterium]HQI79092.1 phosphate signaling complex protein PhoU [Petrotogaceae bacterium]
MENTRHYDNEMLFLRAEVSKMLSLVLESFELAVKSLEDVDTFIADKVIAGDDAIDDLNRQIEETVYMIVARYSPQSKDLRYAMTMVKFANNLERIADLSCNIAEMTKDIYEKNIKINLIKDIKRMFGICLQMIKDTYEAFGGKNIKLAIEVWRRDNDIDNLEKIVNSSVIDGICNEQFDKRLAILYILLARDLERIADHSTNLCEEIIYIETGKDIDEFI